MLEIILDAIRMLRILAAEWDDADEGEWIPELHEA